MKKITKVATLAAGLLAGNIMAQADAPMSDMEQLLQQEESGYCGEPTYIQMSEPEPSRYGSTAGGFDSHGLSSWL